MKKIEIEEHIKDLWEAIRVLGKELERLDKKIKQKV